MAWTEHHAPAAPTIPVGAAPQPYIPEVNHVLHLLLTVFTLGLWAPIWVLVAWQNAGARNEAIRRAQGIPV